MDEIMNFIRFIAIYHTNFLGVNLAEAPASKLTISKKRVLHECAYVFVHVQFLSVKL